MRVAVGTQNKAKIEAVKEILKDYSHLKDADVFGVDVQSEVSSQPLSLDETVSGAMNRASNAFHNCNYAIGIESGLMTVSAAKSGYMDVCACAIFDGNEYHIGLSSAWEFPDISIMKLMTEEKMEMKEAVQKAGLTQNTNIGSEEGAIGILTKGRLDRKEYAKQALRMALIHID